MARLLKCFLQRKHQRKNLALKSPPNGPGHFKFPMANCGRSYFIKAALVAGTLLVLLNLYNYRLETNTTSAQMALAHGRYARFSFWPNVQLTYFNAAIILILVYHNNGRNVHELVLQPHKNLISLQQTILLRRQIVLMSHIYNVTLMQHSQQPILPI